MGTWVGDGEGWLPGRDGFVWSERFEVGHVGTPAMWFRQRTRRPDGSPFHAEDGWVRLPPERQVADGGPTSAVELAVASPTGVLEALAGSVTHSGGAVVLDAASTTVAGTIAAAAVDGTRRRWALDGDRLTVDFWMATPAHPTRFHHLRARLHRDGAGGSTRPDPSGARPDRPDRPDPPHPAEDRP